MLFLVVIANAQDANWVSLMSDPEANFYDIQKSFNTYWKNKTVEKGKGYKQFKRWENFMEPRVYPTGRLPHDIIRAEISKVMEERNIQSKSNASLAANWTALGPTNVPTNGLSYPSAGIGRVNCIEVDPANTSTWWVGTPGGGLWKTTNSGASWTSNTDALATLGIADIEIDPTNSNIMYIATGDADGGDTYSIGLLKSTNGGQTWSTTGLTYATSSYAKIPKILINPTNTSILIVATNSGIFRSTNGGTNFTNVLSGIFYDLEFKPGDPNTVYAASYSGSGTAKMYYSTNGGTSFTQATGLPASGVLRISAAVSAASPTTVYALLGSSTDYGYKGLYKSTNSGVSYTLVHSSPNILSGDETGASAGGQAWYDLALAVSPIDANLLYVGGVNVWKSTNGGTSFSITGHWYAGSTGSIPFVHADQHELEFFPNSSNIFSCNDGGIRYSTNNGALWNDFSNSLQIMQFYRLSGSVQNSNIVYSGAQDNGTHQRNATSWKVVYGGDGMQPLVDYSNSNIVYASYQYGNLFRSTNGGLSFSSIKPSGSPDGDWITPYALHPTTNTTIYAGYNEIYKSTNSGTTWTIITSNLSAGVNYTGLKTAKSDGNYIYASTNSKLFKTINGGTSWTNITSGLPVASASITDFTISSEDPNKIWVTFSGYSAANKVMYSSNGGSTWTNISSGLPNLPVNCVEYQTGSDNGIYIGTDVGVYYKNNSIAWQSYMTNLPNVGVRDLEIHYGINKIRAATFGRGLWESDLYTAPVIAPIANFAANNTSIVAGQSVTFTDQSTNIPSTWLWTFTGGNPSSSVMQNPTVQYTTAGTYAVKLKVGNAGGLDSITKTAYIVVSPAGQASCKQWDVQASGFASVSRGIQNFEIVNANTVWAVAYDGSGSNATIRDYTKTTNGGSTWVAGSISGIATSYGLANISSTHSDTAWAAVYPTTTTIAAQGVYKTVNGGTTWTRQTTATYSTATSFINLVHFFNGNDGVAMGDPAGGYFEIYTTNNGGTTWTRVNTNNIPTPIASDEYGTVGYFTSLGNTIWFLTNKGRIYKSINKGLNWTVASTPLGNTISLSEISFKDQNNGLLTGTDANGADIGIYKTTDGGSTWTLLTTNTAGITVKSGLCNIPGTNGAYVITGASTGGAGSAYSTDDGATWTSVDNIQHTAVEFYNELTGWAGGFNTSNTVGGIFKMASSALTSTISPSNNASFCANSTYTLSANANPNYTYQWYLNGNIIPNATASTYDASVAGIYTVEVTEGACTALSASVTLITLTPDPTPTITGAQTFCVGDSVTLTSSIAGNYKWYLNDVQIPNAIARTLTVKVGGSYKVSTTNVNNCTSTSTSFTVVSESKPAKPNLTVNGSSTICNGETVNITSSNSSNIAWYKDGLLIPNSNNMASISVGDAGSYYVIVSSGNGLCRTYSDTVNITVLPLPAKPTITQDTTSLTSSIANAYQWYKSNTAIANANTQTYLVTESGNYKVEITDAQGCKAMSDSINVIVSGIGINSLVHNIQIYPNPSSSNFNVSYYITHNTELEIVLVNMLGQEIKMLKAKHQELQGQHEFQFKYQIPGVYILQLRTQEGTVDRRVIVK